MGKQLNLDTFNEILISAFKDQGPKSIHELYRLELDMAYSTKVEKMENLVEALNNGRPYHKILQEVNNVDSNCDALLKKLQELEEAHPELKEQEEGEE